MAHGNPESIEQFTQEPERQRWIALVVLCAGFLMIILDQTIVNVALPSIQTDLHFSPSGLAWVVNAYLIAFGGLLLLVGRLGDLIGRRRIFMLGLTVFTSASLVCGLAESQAVLVAARFVQGIGGAMTAAVILGMIVTMFPKPSERCVAGQRPDVGRLHDCRGGLLFLGLGSHPEPGRRRAGPLGRIRLAPGLGAESADLAAGVPIPDAHGRERDPGPDGGRDLRHLLPRRSLYAAGAALRRD